VAKIPDFRSGLSAYVPTSSGRFSASAMPSEQKKQMCRSLLAEFGVTHVNERHDELIHSCCLPFGAHKNGDRNASASLNYEKLTYNCLGCGSSGGLLWFIATCRGEDTRHSRDWLESELGLVDSEESLEKLLTWIDDMYASSTRDGVVIPKMARSVLQQWRFIHPYMTEDRRIPVETYKRFEVGYGTIRTPIDDGTFISSERIIIPHFWKGDLVGWQSRRLNKSDGTAKYLSSPDMPKDVTIYNYDPRRAAVVVESPMSVLSKWHRCPVIEATFGAKVTDKQIALLAEHEAGVTLWMDNDDAGWKATRRLGEALRPYCPVFVIPSTWAADPADLDDTEFERLMGERIPYALWSEPEELDEWKVPDGLQEVR
jgi:hypothetical protein